MKRILAALMMTIVLGSPAYASAKVAGASAPVYGYDVSYPQCGSKLPTGQQFGIVGLNDGLANTLSPCFGAELSWAQQGSKGGTGQPKAAVYVNTANPGDVTPTVSDWPTSGSNGYGTCDHKDTTACAYEYGKERAAQDVKWAGSGQFSWWLDVETTNSWSGDMAANAAALEGMTGYLESQGGTVGVYSTGQQWSKVIGSYSGDGSLLGLGDWVAGATSLAGAQANCLAPAFSPLGQVSVAQYVAHGAKIDSDYACL